MSNALLILAYVFVVLAYLVAIGNIAGTVGAWMRTRKGEREFYSQVPLLTILFVLIAGLLAGDQINRWVAFAAVIIDPGTWVIVLLPPYLALRLFRSIRGRCPTCGYDLRGLSPGAEVRDQKSEVSVVCPECGRSHGG